MVDISHRPGPIMLFGSGETSPSGQKIFDHIFQILPASPKVALLETPAGFELNSEMVIKKISDFLKDHLQNYSPATEIIPARKKKTKNSPDNPALVSPILEADLIFMGPGSPTYTVNQLQDSLAWKYIIARHALGAGLALSSAAVIASGAYALPIYEIYKVGEDLHWKRGLDFFAPYNLALSFIPHWNNTDGGAELDTSHCFMGALRFENLLQMLPENQTVIGIDEHTGLYINCIEEEARVIGKGKVTIIKDKSSNIYDQNAIIPLKALGNCREPDLNTLVTPDIWKDALDAEYKHQKKEEIREAPPESVLILVKKREQARLKKEWARADALREKINHLGWQISDTQDGPTLIKSRY